MTPMKTRDKIVKTDDVLITANMLIDELNKYDSVLADIKKLKYGGLIQ